MELQISFFILISAISSVFTKRKKGYLFMPLPLLAAGAIVAGAGAIGKGIAKGFGARKKKKLAQRLEKQGNALESEAWAGKTDYQSPEEIAQLQGLAEANLNDNSLENAIKANADIGATNMLSRGKRASTSSNDAASNAMLVEAQRIAGHNQGDIQGAQQNLANLGFLAQATQLSSQANQDEYNANTLLPFRLRYAKSQQLQQAGLQGKIDSINENTAAWASIGDGFIDAGTSLMGAPEDAFIRGKKAKGPSLDQIRANEGWYGG